MFRTLARKLFAAKLGKFLRNYKRSVSYKKLLPKFGRRPIKGAFKRPVRRAFRRPVRRAFNPAPRSTVKRALSKSLPLLDMRRIRARSLTLLLSKNYISFSRALFLRKKQKSLLSSNFRKRRYLNYLLTIRKNLRRLRTVAKSPSGLKNNVSSVLTRFPALLDTSNVYLS